MTSLLPVPVWQPLDNNGNIIPGGQVFTYEPNTTVSKTTWVDAVQSATNTNPIILNSGGRANTVYGSGTYRIILKDAVGNQIYDLQTDSTLDESVISAVMLPVVGALTLQSARDEMGITDAIQTAIDNVQLLPGPPGPTGATGAQGPTGPQGPAGSGGGSSSSLDTQFFSASGTWTKPAFGSTAIIEIWGSGGSGGAYSYGGGGNGGYVSITTILSELPASVAVTIGAGGIGTAVAGAYGNPGDNTSFGSLVVMGGGQGGSFDGLNNVPITGAPGKLVSAATSTISLLSGSYDTSGMMSGTDGGRIFVPAVASIFGGSGGAPGSSGANGGGGGGSSNDPSGSSGSGGLGQMIVSVF